MTKKTNIPGINRTLKALRVFNRLTQRRLAEKLKVSNVLISEIESGKRVATIQVVSKYAALFDIQTSEIVYLGEAYDENHFKKTLSGLTLRLIDWITTDEAAGDVKLVPTNTVEREKRTENRRRIERESFSDAEFGFLDQRKSPGRRATDFA